MPSPDHPNNLSPNLDTLANLVNKKGSKLSYDKTSGRFSIQEPGVFNQSLARTFSSDSVKSEEYFGAPIRALFAAAYANIDLRHAFTEAVEGLKALRNSYTGEKLAILNAVIADAELGVKKDPDYAIQLRKSYERYLRFGLAQVMFLPGTNPGICYSFTVHWARRILIGKTYFGISKKNEAEVRPLTLDAGQKARIMKKVDKTIRPLQDELKNYKPSVLGSRVMDLARGKEDKRLTKYGNLFVLDVCEDQVIGATERGSEIMSKVLQAASGIKGQPAKIFLVSLRKKAEGHAIGIHLEGALHFFDPNLGEFEFPTGSEKDLASFLDEWWQTFYMVSGSGGMVQHFQYWRLESVQVKKEKESDVVFQIKS